MNADNVFLYFSSTAAQVWATLLVFLVLWARDHRVRGVAMLSDFRKRYGAQMCAAADRVKNTDGQLLRRAAASSMALRAGVETLLKSKVFLEPNWISTPLPEWPLADAHEDALDLFDGTCVPSNAEWAALVSCLSGIAVNLVMLGLGALMSKWDSAYSLSLLALMNVFCVRPAGFVLFSLMRQDLRSKYDPMTK